MTKKGEIMTKKQQDSTCENAFQIWLKTTYRDIDDIEKARLKAAWMAGQYYNECGSIDGIEVGLNSSEQAELTLLIIMTNCADPNERFYWDRRRILMRKATDEQKELAVKEAYER